MQMVDGVGWGYELECGQTRRSVTVIANRRALEADVAVAAETRAAIDTYGRSEAHKAAHLADPPRVVVLGRGGYLSAPPTLERVGR